MKTSYPKSVDRPVEGVEHDLRQTSQLACRIPAVFDAKRSRGVEYGNHRGQTCRDREETRDLKIGILRFSFESLIFCNVSNMP